MRRFRSRILIYGGTLVTIYLSTIFGELGKAHYEVVRDWMFPIHTSATPK